MAEDLAMVPVVAKHVAEGVTASVDFNSGEAAIGTGPFRFAEFRPGDRVRVVRNADYWGGEVAWDEVVFRPIGEDAARLAALINGDGDMIDYPPTADLPQMRENPELVVSAIPSDRLIYLMPAFRDREEYVTDIAGAAMVPNPLRDWRVRKALSLAINREAIRDRIMGGAALPTRNVVPPGFFGYVEGLEADPYDPEEAAALLSRRRATVRGSG
ncbi:hypothetical protein BH23PSE1_BH23PSE1_10410 [soil metagenome]